MLLKKTFAVISIALLVSSQAAAQQPAATERTVQVRKNTALKFTLLNELNSATAQVGDAVPLRLYRPLVINGVTLLPEGYVVNGKITSVTKAIRNSQEADIKWGLERVPFLDSTGARAKVWFYSPRKSEYVPDNYQRNLQGHEDFGAQEVTNIVIFCLVLPVAIVVWLIERADMVRGYEDTRIPANATVAVIITKDHRVSY